MPTSNLKKRPGPLLLWCFFLVAGMGSQGGALAQASVESNRQCTQIPVLYQLANYTVKNITVQPLLRFIPGGSNLEDALSAVISSQPTASGLRANARFDTAGVSFLEAALNDELERRTLNGKMGLIFARHRVINCDEHAQTLDVQYQVLTVARPSYLTTSYETRDRKEKDQEAAGNIEEDRRDFSMAPFVGYNRSRGIFGGSGLSYSTDSMPFRKLAMSASGSGSSAVVEMDMTGSKDLLSGPFSYLEWKTAYRFSNIPTDGFESKEATVAARLFAATRPIGSHKLFFRFGASVEGGNRQSDLPQSAAEP